MFDPATKTGHYVTDIPIETDYETRLFGLNDDTVYALLGGTTLKKYSLAENVSTTLR